MQFITDDKGGKLGVVLTMEAYNKMLEQVEELEDIKSYDEAKKGPLEFVDADEAFKEIEAKRVSNHV